ncbi:hypothetical protein NUW58_g7755 [Xylaria curta]|uniref:Uncharacterized protein n=1 Tax=Xylaria curta TaxID=42375 RepID=A0ACC1NGS6_9PEZI|nr:hypothetical protein NUW58_g7755 [Xylaria curta]
MASHKQLVDEIDDQFHEIQRQIKGLRENWRTMEISGIDEVVEATKRAIKFAKTGLSNPTNMEEYEAVSYLVGVLEDYYIEAQGVLHEAKINKEKAAQQEWRQEQEKRGQKGKGKERLSTIKECSDEGSS